MQTFAILAALAASVVAQGVTSAIAPASAAPAGCSPNFNGHFEITTVQPAAKRDLTIRDSACPASGILVISLADGKLTDNLGRFGYIASNYQFQFDGGVPQAGAIYTAGFSVCGNGSLAIGGTTIFYSCASGLANGGTIYNLYSQSVGAQCQEVNIDAIPCSGGSVSSVTSAAPTSVVPVAMSTSVVVNTTSVAPVTTSSSVIITTTTTSTPVAPISEATDGQPQATLNATKAVTTPSITPGAGAIFTAPAALMIAGAVAAAFL